MNLITAADLRPERLARVVRDSGLLKDTSMVTSAICRENRDIYHLYLSRTAQGDALQAHLRSQDVAAGIQHPVPLHLQRALSDLGYCPGVPPVMVPVAGKITSLTMHAGLTDGRTEYIAGSIKVFCAPPVKG